jgi:beta-alanine degradation protein BauB
MQCGNLLLTAILLAMLAVPVVFGQQFTQIDLSHGPFDLTNNFVRVIHISIPPHGVVSLKASSVESIAVSLRDCVLKINSDKGSLEQWAATAGSVIWMQSDTAYSFTNQNDMPAELQISEFLGSHRINQVRVPHTSYDPVNVDPQHFRTIFENEQLRVLHLSIGPRAETEDVQFSAGALITLQDSRTISTWRDGKIRDDQRAAGSVSWEQSGLHSIKNMGDKPVDSLLLELKRPFVMS